MFPEGKLCPQGEVSRSPCMPDMETEVTEQYLSMQETPAFRPTLLKV